LAPGTPLARVFAPRAEVVITADGVSVSDLTGSAARALFNASRDTVLANVAAEPGARWARHASANACSFCRLMATRGEPAGQVGVDWAPDALDAV
ncbi:hypothetical protein RA989_21590, partial [Mycobacteroides abscessus subsp. massiliense]